MNTALLTRGFTFSCSLYFFVLIEKLPLNFLLLQIGFGSHLNRFPFADAKKQNIFTKRNFFPAKFVFLQHLWAFQPEM